MNDSETQSVPTPQPPGRSPARILWNITEGFRGRYGAAMAAMIVASALGFLPPLVGGVALDAIASSTSERSALEQWVLQTLGGRDWLITHLWIAPCLMAGLMIVSGGFSRLRAVWSAEASEGIARKLRNQMFDHFNRLPVRFHDQADTGDLVQRSTSDVETVRMFLAQQVIEVSHALVLAACVLPLMLALHPGMTLVSFALLPPVAIYGYIYFRRVGHIFLEVDQAEGALTAVAQENLAGIRVVRAFARQDHQIGKFAPPNARYRDKLDRMMTLMAWYWSTSDLITLAQTGLTLFVGAYWVSQNHMTVGTLYAFLAFLNLLLWPVRQMGRLLTDLSKALVALGRIGEILDRAAEGAHDPAPLPNPQSCRGGLRLEGVGFSHSAGLPCLQDVSFAAAPGQTIALLGPSGAGKSTIVHLLLRLFEFDQGRIVLDEVEIRQLSRRWIREQIAAVLQEPFLFSRSLRENIRLGRSSSRDEEIFEAARAAAIHDTIERFDRGYDTVIGERGLTLSGGQRQRIAIARAILRNPPILILDDALSAVDSETEQLILRALESRRGRATTLVIAHRLSTLQHADQIIVLDQGKVIQQGTHAQLSACDGLYRRLWDIQAGHETLLAEDLARVDAPTHRPSVSPLQPS